MHKDEVENKIVAERPLCATGGMIRPGAMCRMIIVGGKLVRTRIIRSAQASRAEAGRGDQ